MTYTPALRYEGSAAAVRGGDLLPPHHIVGGLAVNIQMSEINAHDTAVNT